MAESGKTDEIKGRVKSAYGELADDPNMKEQGAIDKAAGKFKQGVEHLKEKAHDLMDRKKT